MIRTLLWFTVFWLYQLYSLVVRCHYWYLGKTGQQDKQANLLHRETTRWAKTMVRFTGSDVQVQGLEKVPERNVLFVSNHQGNFDIPLLIGYIPKLKGFVAKVELEKLPIVSGWMKKLNCLFLDRNDMRQSLKVILEGIKLLKNGYNMVIFPEGTRSKGKKMGTFKKGSLKLAIKSGVPIVPITIDGSYRMLEQDKRIRKSQVVITIHDPIYMDALSKEDEDQLVDRVYDVIKSGLNAE